MNRVPGVLLLIAGCSAHADDGFDDLCALPEVSSVEVTGPANAAKTLIHIRDYHYISRELYVKDFGSEEGYDAFLQKIDQVQRQQLVVLRQLIKQHGVKAVFVERVSEQNADLLHDQAETFRRLHSMLAEVKKTEGAKARELEKQTQDVIDEGRERYLELGVAGRLLIEGDPVEVLPLEDEKALDEAKPKLVDGKFTFDPVKTRVREEAMVRNAFSRAPVAVIILGGGHDLSGRLPAECRYVKVTVKAYKD